MGFFINLFFYLLGSGSPILTSLEEERLQVLSDFQGWIPPEPGMCPQGAAPAAPQSHSFLPRLWTSPPRLSLNLQPSLTKLALMRLLV